MTSDRKYAGLPDLDVAPDIYETPELTDDNLTNRTSTTFRSESPVSSYNELDEDHRTGIDRQRLDPDEARTHFLPSQGDGKNTGSSGRIQIKRRQYRDRSRRGPEDDDNDASDDEDDESLERKIARLRREITEVKGEVERRKMHDNSGLSTEAGDEEDTLDALNDALNAVNTENAPSRIVKRLGTALKSTDTTKGTTKPIQTNPGQEESTYTVTYAPTFQQTYALSKVADFDARLTLIEAALGIGTIPLPAQDTFPNKAVLPVLNSLDRQLSTLSSSTETSVDLIDRKVRQLTEDAQKLTDARTAARAAQKALNLTLIQSEHPPAETDEMKTLSGIVDAEHTSKINALYGTLATIDSLAPLLPPVLDRLRSLQSIHVDASNASQSLADLQIRQEAMLEDLRSWRGGLEKVEEAVKHGEQTMTGNVRVVESWVKELEDRMKKLGQ